MSYSLFGLKLYTPQEAAEMLGLEAKQIKRLLNASHLYGEKFDNRWLIPEPSISAFRYIQAEREKISGEVAQLKNILDAFLRDGDITKTYHDNAMKRLTEFLPLVKGKDM